MAKGTVLRGAIDELEEAWAVLVLDDGQRLNWPRDRLGPGAAGGSAVALHLEEVGDVLALAAGTWVGVLGAQTQTGTTHVSITLGTQRLNWPRDRLAPDVVRGLGAGGEVLLCMQVDEQDTARRRQQVQDLVNDLFG